MAFAALVLGIAIGFALRSTPELYCGPLVDISKLPPTMRDVMSGSTTRPVSFYGGSWAEVTCLAQSLSCQFKVPHFSPRPDQNITSFFDSLQQHTPVIISGIRKERHLDWFASLKHCIDPHTAHFDRFDCSRLIFLFEKDIPIALSQFSKDILQDVHVFYEQ